MYRLNVQVTHSLRTQNFGGSKHITGTAEPKVVKFCTRVGYINSSNRMTYHTGAWLWSRDCFKILSFAVMQCRMGRDEKV